MSRKTPPKVEGLPPPPGRKILIVEDDIDARLVMEEFLTAQGYGTSVSKSVAEARALLSSDLHYDLVLLDLMLPGGEGTELLELRRAQPPKIRSAPVVVVSAFAPPTIDGVDVVLHKPVDLGQLQAVIERLLAPRKK